MQIHVCILHSAIIAEPIELISQFIISFVVEVIVVLIS